MPSLSLLSFRIDRKLSFIIFRSIGDSNGERGLRRVGHYTSDQCPSTFDRCGSDRCAGPDLGSEGDGGGGAGGGAQHDAGSAQGLGQVLSLVGRVLDSKPKGYGFEAHCTQHNSIPVHSVTE